MEAMKMKLFLAVVLAAAMAFSAVNPAAASVEAPAPSPPSGASSFVPALFASVAALAFGLLI
ncbi:PREDICTED: arabinogalactan peptide 13-like [Tarenaya hassleriana]|uniref:arabinogalactan peptide 13-like n=1 Tax=Tarenaya hassleriana TaxID=28532 RepID=UPI0008FCFB7B|nr:PREDICTED: arabinogalactan peptide 13-like [Tarenaya hassleriana]